MEAKHVYRQSFRVTFGSRATVRYAVDPGVMDHRVHSTDPVNLFRNPVCLGSTAKIADHHSERSRRHIAEVIGTGPRARMQQNLVAILDEIPRCCIAEPICAAGDENTTHISGF